MSTERRNGLEPLTRAEAHAFQRRLAIARQQLAEIDSAIELELRRARQRIEALHERREEPLKVYGAACTMLGIRNEFDDGSADG